MCGDNAIYQAKAVTLNKMQQVNNLITGLWLGKRVGGDSSVDFRWNLSLTDSNSFPSAFGGSSLSMSSSSNLLVGTWTSVDGQLNLRESQILANESQLLYIYSARLIYSVDDKNASNDDTGATSPCLVGIWESIASGESGQFICRKEKLDPNTHISGLWIGEAIPDESLKDFYLPVNPICWSLTIIRKRLANRLTCPPVFGSGYFDDAADIKDQPVICFSLSASQLSDEFIKNCADSPVACLEAFRLVKTYEFTEETKDIQVHYSCRLMRSASGEYSIEGTWENRWAGSHGHFHCKLVLNYDCYDTHLIFCNNCNEKIANNSTMWECRLCSPQWRCCQKCKEANSHSHSHPLVKECKFKNECVKGTSCAEIAFNALQAFGNRPFIGTRTLQDPLGYEWLSYQDIFDRIIPFISNLNTIIDVSTLKKQYCLIIGDLNVPYIVSVVSSLMLGLVLVPVDGNLDNMGLQHIVRQINPVLAIAEQQYWASLMPCFSSDAHLTAIIIPQHSQEIPPSDNVNIKVINYNNLLSAPSSVVDVKALIDSRGIAVDRITAILFTSGSSGLPKGAVYTEQLMIPAFGVSNVEPLVRFDFQKFHPSFIVSLLSIMRCGGRRTIATDLGDLLQSIELARPTHVSAPPVLFQLLHSEYLCRLKSAKKHAPEENLAALQSQIANEVKGLLGNRLVSLSSGGAALSPSLLTFCNQTLNLKMADLYGSRETGPIAMNGIIYSSVDVRVMSIENGCIESEGQGEILVHSPRLIQEYLKDTEKTNNAFILIEGQGFYKTGDFGEVYFANRTKYVKLLDRVGFAVKMVNGEWLSPARIESILESNSWIEQAAVFGSPQHSFPVAIIVPSKRMTEIAAEPFASSDSLDVCTQKIMEEVRICCEHHHIKHIPQRILLLEGLWSVNNGFLTPTLKKRRKFFLEHFKSQISELFNSLEPQYTGTGDSKALSDAWKRCLELIFPASSIEFPSSVTLAHLGADSLQVARLQRILQDQYNRAVSLKDLLHYSIGYLDQILFSESEFLPSLPIEFDWNEEKKICIPARTQLGKDGSGVFLTGCTGFFGPLILLELLEQYPNHQIYCLMTDADPVHATNRLYQHLIETGDSRVPTKDGLASRVQILTGDLAKEHFGLSTSAWQVLIEQTTTIVHNGAIVNLVLPYSRLKPVNVGGTRTVIELAALSGASIHYISSVSVLSPEFAKEQWLPSHYCTQSAGYAASKVISESLLQQAWKKGIPVSIYRISTISGHQQSGYFNVKDFTGILISVCAHVQAAVSDSEMRLQWIPVDYVAKAVIGISKHPYDSNANIFHLFGNQPKLRDVIEVLKDFVPVRPVSVQEWRKLISNLPASYQHFAILSSFMNLHFQDNLPPCDSSLTKETLESLNLPIPHISKDTIRLYLDYLQKQGSFH